jgi:hypothetical protein
VGGARTGVLFGYRPSNLKTAETKTLSAPVTIVQSSPRISKFTFSDVADLHHHHMKGPHISSVKLLTLFCNIVVVSSSFSLSQASPFTVDARGFLELNTYLFNYQLQYPLAGRRIKAV